MASPTPPDSLPKSAEVVVIGGGVNGLSTAFQLTKRGVRDVVILEQRWIGAGASGKSGALVRAHYPNVPESMLTLESMRIFKNWDEEIGAGSPNFETTGFLQVVGPADEENLRANVADQQAMGVETSVVSPGELAELEPLLNVEDLACAAYEPNSGFADPNATLYGFAEAAQNGGATLFEDTQVLSIITQGDKVTGVETNRGHIATESVLLAGGAWAGSLLEPLGIDLGLVPMRLQVAIFRWPPAMTGRHPHPVVIDGTQHAWLRTEGANSTLIGAEGRVSEADPRGFSESIEAPYVDEARAALAHRFPVFANATMRGGWSGMIMVSPDSHPIIDQVPSVPGLFLMSGDSGTSFKTSPAIGICLAEWITEGKASLIDMTPFRSTRFAEGKPWVDEHSYGNRPWLTASR